MRIPALMMIATIAVGAGPAMAADGVPSESSAAAKFGARDSVDQISISPDGKNIAVIAPTPGRGSAVLIMNLDGELRVTPIARSSGAPDRLSYCQWATNTRLVCSIYFVTSDAGTVVTLTRLIAVNIDGSDIKQLSAPPSSRALAVVYDGGNVIDWSGDGTDGADGKVLMTRQFVAELEKGTFITAPHEGYGVELVDTRTLRRQTVESPKADAETYISDGNGKVRLMGVRPTDGVGYEGDKVRYFYRKKGSQTWEKLTVQSNETGDADRFEPIAVDTTLDVAYGFGTSEGHSALFSIALDGSLKRTLVFARPNTDIDETVRIGRQHRVVGVSFANEKRQVEMFDPVMKRFTTALAKAIPNLPLVQIVDASADEQRLILWAGSDVDPGRFYMFDRSNRHLTELLAVRSPLADTKLANVKPITFQAADGTAIPGYLTLPPGSDGKNLPAIILPHGGPAARDEWSFDWLPQFFAARGYAVLQPNYRGSSGYGDAWFQQNGFKSWRIAMSDVIDGAHYLEKQGIAAPGKIAIVGWSYGGYAALQTAMVNPDMFKAIVAIAPVTDLDKWRDELRSFSSFKLRDAFIGKGAHVDAGSPARHAAQIKAPVLLFHGDLDRNVGVRESRVMAAKLKAAGKSVEYVEFKGLDHQLEDSDVRAEMLDKADRFLRVNLGLTDLGPN